jgi:hypothetical protein
MTWDNVPYMIQLQGAAHAPEVFRNALHVSTGGAEGVNSPTDCKVTATTVPGGTVNVAIGSVLIVARHATAFQESYADVNRTVDNVQVTSTGATKRSDLVAAIVEDPGVAGAPYDDPDNPAIGPYMFTRVIPNVPAGTTRLQDVAGYANVSGFALARIDIPANTATVTNAMIVDLRKIARPRQEKVNLTDLGATPGVLNQTAGTLFPPFQPSVTVPSWATHVRVDMTIAGLSAGGSTNGFANVSVRAADGTTVVVDGDQVAFNADVSAGVNTRFVHIASTPSGDVRAQRGKVIKPSSYMRKAAADRGNVTYDQYSQMRMEVVFDERIV